MRQWVGKIRPAIGSLAAAGILSAPFPCFAQTDDADASPSDQERVVIDILVPPPDHAPPSALDVRECEEQRDAAQINGEIIVCRQIGEDNANYFSGSREEWLRNYARETAYINDPQAPNVDGPGITSAIAFGVGISFQGCFIPPCPPPKAIVIDVEALPEAPVGSDAERVAQGQEPLEDDFAPLSETARRKLQAELGLPEPPKPVE